MNDIHSLNSKDKFYQATQSTREKQTLRETLRETLLDHFSLFDELFGKVDELLGNNFFKLLN